MPEAPVTPCTRVVQVSVALRTQSELTLQFELTSGSPIALLEIDMFASVRDLRFRLGESYLELLMPIVTPEVRMARDRILYAKHEFLAEYGYRNGMWHWEHLGPSRCHLGAI